jgi:hypothetical protein
MILGRVITSVVEADYAEYESWVYACLLLGATQEQVRAFNQAAQAYAATTTAPNHAVVERLRFVAKNELARARPFPSVEEAVEINRREWLLSQIRPYHQH